jgi:hypothetical protein
MEKKKTEENKEEISFAFLFLFENKYRKTGWLYTGLVSLHKV